MSDVQTKLCNKCNTEKPSNEMVKRGDGYKNECKDCKNAAAREKLKTDSNHREKEKQRASAKYRENKEKHCAITKRYYQENLEWRKDLHLRKTYGITMDEKLKMRDDQKNMCAICHLLFQDDKSAYVDHCHSTKHVRGLLCHNCNTGLGMFKDNVDNMQRAIEYLSGYVSQLPETQQEITVPTLELSDMSRDKHNDGSISSSPPSLVRTS